MSAHSGQNALETMAEAAILLKDAERLYHGLHRSDVARAIGELATVAMTFSRLLDVQEQRTRRSEPLYLLRAYASKERNRRP